MTKGSIQGSNEVKAWGYEACTGSLGMMWVPSIKFSAVDVIIPQWECQWPLIPFSQKQ